MRNVEATIARTYNKRFTKLGAVPEASLWFSKERQLVRFKLIADVVAQVGLHVTCIPQEAAGHHGRTRLVARTGETEA